MSEVDQFLMEAAENSAATPPGELLEWLQLKAQQVAALEERIEKGTKLLAELGDKLRELTEKEIPQKFLDNQITGMQVGNTVIKIDKFYNAKIPEGREDEAFAWLEETGNDVIIKSELSASFGKGEEEKKKREAAVNALRDAHVPFKEKRGVHPMTLKSFVKETMEAGENIPQDLFGVYVGHRAKLTRK